MTCNVPSRDRRRGNRTRPDSARGCGARTQRTQRLFIRHQVARPSGTPSARFCRFIIILSSVLNYRYYHVYTVACAYGRAATAHPWPAAATGPSTCGRHLLNNNNNITIRRRRTALSDVHPPTHAAFGSCCSTKCITKQTIEWNYTHFEFWVERTMY